MTSVAHLGRGRVRSKSESDLVGLTDAEVLERVCRGQTNDVPQTTSRTLLQIVRANVLTPFNALLGGLLVVILVVGPIQDALFGGILVANALVGIVQELRAKRTLDRLAVLTPPGPGRCGRARFGRSPSAESSLTTFSRSGPAIRSSWTAISSPRAVSRSMSRCWVLGAPDVLLDARNAEAVRARAGELAAEGRRVLLLGRAPGGIRGEELPREMEPAALVILRDRVRSDAPEILRYFAQRALR
jgi:hypothetical protein